MRKRNFLNSSIKEREQLAYQRQVIRDEHLSSNKGINSYDEQSVNQIENPSPFYDGDVQIEKNNG